MTRLEYIDGFEDVVTDDGENYPGYKIDRQGHIINYTNKLLKTKIKKQYYCIKLSNGNGKKVFSIHRLVASTFLDNPKNLSSVNHINKDKLDNSIDNLEWCTIRHNNIEAQGKKVHQIDIKTDKIIKTYNSLSDAAKALDMKSFQSISHACNGVNKTSFGYKWQFA